MTVVARIIDEYPVPGKPLGRHVEHDPESRAYAVTAAPVPLRTVHHRRYGGPFDQGATSSCTGNAAAGAMNTAPLYTPGRRILTEQDALTVYELATTLDSIPGSYPPDDTGSSGLAVAKALQQKGLISGYRHAFSLAEALQALQAGPVIAGIDWYQGFDSPNPAGVVEIAGEVRGGHEIEILGYERAAVPLDALVVFENSWGVGYGVNGRGKMSVRTLGVLLDAQGDVTVLIR